MHLLVTHKDERYSFLCAPHDGVLGSGVRICRSYLRHWVEVGSRLDTSTVLRP
jgi:hypothetical protein